VTSATSKTAREADDSGREETCECDARTATPFNAYPLPGVMDFIGANVGDELAEERWR
jgi:hypothetical protein